VNIELKNITKEYVTPGTSNRRLVLDNLSLIIQQGESISIIGPSGSGKTTLLNILGTLDDPSAGELLYDGKNRTAFMADELALFRNQHIGFVFQAHHLLPQLTLLENVLLPTLIVKERNKIEMQERALDLLSKLKLENLQHPDEPPGTAGR